MLGDSIVAGFLRYLNIWYKLFDENTINCGIGGDKIQNELWRAENIPLPKSLEYLVISCGPNNLDTDDSEKIADGLFCIALALKKRMNQLKIVINGILPRDEQNTARRQKLFIVNELLESKCTNYVNTDIYYLSPDRDWIRENGCLDIYLFYKDKLHLFEKGYLKLALSIKRKISLFQKKFTNTKKIEKRQKPFFNPNDFPPLPSKPNTNTNKQDYSKTMNASPGKYTTHSTSASTETYLLQSQPNTKEILPTKKKTLISTTFPPKQAKTQSISTPVSKQLIPTIEQSTLDELPNTDKDNFITKNKYILSHVQQANNGIPVERTKRKKSSRVHNSWNLWKVNLS